MKPLKPMWRRDGKCYICGKSTKLNIHQNCGKKSPVKRKKVTYKKEFVNYLASIE